MSFVNFLIFRKKYYKILQTKNLHYFNSSTGEVDGVKVFEPTKAGYVGWLDSLNNCSVYIDEAWEVIDAYEKTNFSLAGRNFILKTRHKMRVINLIAQRPTSIQVSARGNVNRFYKCEKFQFMFFWTWFVRKEYQDMEGETVNETVDPISFKKYRPSMKVFNSYNSWAFASGQKSQDVFYEEYHLHFKQRSMLLYRHLRSFFSRQLTAVKRIFRRDGSK